MKLGLIAAAPLPIQIHLATVIPAFLIGTWLIFLSVKGSRPHRMLGVVYLTLMTITAVTTFFIRSLDPPHLSLLHLLIPVTLFAVLGGIAAARRGDVRGHRRAMILLYVGALLIAGGFTFLPGRLMHDVFFG
jgi:uncharacterized membrane protein